MSYQKIKTKPDLSLTSDKHQKAIQDGINHFMTSPFNVRDEFKSSSKEEIKKVLKQQAFPYAVACENWINDFNMASAIRNANGFGAEAFYYVGNKKADRRGSCGTYNYIDVSWMSSIEEFIELKSQYEFIGVDNIPGSIVLSEFLSDFDKNKKYLFIFGEEGCGLTEEMQKLCSKIVHIQMYGSVRSLNCATASGIFMHSFVSALKE